MKKYFIVFYWLLSKLLIFNSWGCLNQKIKIQDAQSQNVEFLVQQAKQLWEQRSDSNSVINLSSFGSVSIGCHSFLISFNIWS